VFWVLTLVSGYLVTRSNFYIASINQQLAFAVRAQFVSKRERHCLLYAESSRSGSGTRTLALVPSKYLLFFQKWKSFFFLMMCDSLPQGGIVESRGVEGADPLYVDAFNYLMPLGGLVSVPISGWVMVHLGLHRGLCADRGHVLPRSRCCKCWPTIPLTVQVKTHVHCSHTLPLWPFS